jgi:uncharacterized protein (TIGR03086 family)
MSEISTKFRWVAAAFTERAQQVPDAAWDDPAPCEGWVARDIVRHLVEWIPGLCFTGAGLELPAGPSVDEDPVGAWLGLRDAIQAALDDPEVAVREFDTPPGRVTFEQAVDQFATSDVFLHTWDLARAAGLDDRLDPAEVRHMLTAMEPMDEILRRSGHYGPRVEVPDDADDQTKLVAFIGRDPAWRGAA